MAKGKPAPPATLEDVVEKLDLIARLMVVRLVNKDVPDMQQKDVVKLMVKHGLKKKDVSDLLDMLPSNVSHSLNK